MRMKSMGKTMKLGAQKNKWSTLGGAGYRKDTASHTVNCINAKSQQNPK